jgi:CCR4-NOT transcription complex subunit 1
MYIAEHDDEFQEIAQTASKENLDLGCKMIKRAVIDKALRKVREDVVMNAAIEKRERAAQNGITNFIDDEITKTMVDLPPQLQPNKNGLDAAQFKVYSDFSKLNYRSRLDQPLQ